MSLEEELLQDAPLVLLNFYKIVSFKHYAGIVIGTDNKQFAIYGHTSIGHVMQQSVFNQDNPRPSTHDLVHFLCSGFDIRLLRVVINDYKDCVFFSRMFFEQKQGHMTRVINVDARPSDSIPIALFHNAPILCVKPVFDAAISYCE